MSKFKPVKYEADGCRLDVFGVLFEADSPEEAILCYRQGEMVFWNSWRGSFYGVLQDEKNGITILFNDHIGSKMLFYGQKDGQLVWGTNPFTLAHSIGAEPDNEIFFWQLLIYGYSPVCETPYKEIKRLGAGEYIKAQNGKVEKLIYHRFANTPNNLSLEENIERIDAAFRKAVERVIRKNEEYGYTHYIALSAGLDSRMTNCVAHEIAKTPIHNITYSQSGYYDETTPRELANYWHNKMYFTPLDNGDCLMNLDEVSRLTSGLVHYSGASETLYGLPKIAQKDAGVFLTGMLGDLIIGTCYTKRDSNQQYHIGEGAFVKHSLDRLYHALPETFEQIYPNREIFYIYVRGFNGMNLGSPIIHQAYGESYSPFCDVDVLSAAYAAPLEQRWNNRLYDQWILTKYPDMAQWKHNGINTIGHRHKQISLFGRSIPINDIPKRTFWYILKRLHIHDANQQTEGHSMTPEDSWFAQNESLRNWAENYMQTNMVLLDPFPELRKMAVRLSRGNAIERMQVLSLLACLRQTR